MHTTAVQLEQRLVNDIEFAPAALLPLCAGHFPGDPIVPGAELLGLALGGSVGFGPLVVSRVAFRRVVRPTAPLTVHHPVRGEIELFSEGELAVRVKVAAPGPAPTPPQAPAPLLPDHDLPTPEALIAHRPPALLLKTLLARAPGRAVTEALPEACLSWTRLLDALAQTAGLAGPEGPPLATEATDPLLGLPRRIEIVPLSMHERRLRVVAGYEDVHLVRAPEAPLILEAWRVRRVGDLELMQTLARDTLGPCGWARVALTPLL